MAKLYFKRHPQRPGNCEPEFPSSIYLSAINISTCSNKQLALFKNLISEQKQYVVPVQCLNQAQFQGNIHLKRSAVQTQLKNETIWKKFVMLKRLQKGGRKSIMANKWAKFTVKYSMTRFLRTGGGMLLIKNKGEPFLAIISNIK